MSLAKPDGPVELYGFAGAVTLMVAVLALHVDLLDEAYTCSLETGKSETGLDTAAGALASCARIRRALTSLLEDGSLAPPDSEVTLRAAARELLDMTELLGAFAAALTGTFRGIRGGREPSAQHLSILSLDIAGSSHHSDAGDARSHTTWIEGGLDLAAQWARAFSGWERPERKGDEIMVEFEEDGDATVLAAAAVLCHTRALRSTEIGSISWRFHSGVDCGEVESLGHNLIGRCLNRAARIAKCGDGREDAKLVMLTKEAAERCSEQMVREPVATWGERLTLAKSEDGEVLMGTVPCRVDSHEAIARLTAGMRETAQSVWRTLPSSSSDRHRLNVEPLFAEEQAYADEQS